MIKAERLLSKMEGKLSFRGDYGLSGNIKRNFRK